MHSVLAIGVSLLVVYGIKDNRSLCIAKPNGCFPCLFLFFLYFRIIFLLFYLNKCYFFLNFFKKSSTFIEDLGVLFLIYDHIKQNISCRVILCFTFGYLNLPISFCALYASVISTYFEFTY